MAPNLSFIRRSFSVFFPSSYERIPTDPKDDNAETPLLLSTMGGLDDETNIAALEHPKPWFNFRPKPWFHRHQRLLIVFFVAVSILATLAVVLTHERVTDFDDPVVAARLSIDALYARQSSTIEQATARYSLKTGRSPPPRYKQWFNFAKEKSCLIDDYDQIHRDFEPFYQLADDDPLFFQRMIDIASDMMKEDPKEMATIVIKDGAAQMLDNRPSAGYYDTWPTTFAKLSEYLPDMTFLINGRDEPRVVFNYREPDVRKHALEVTEKVPFGVLPHPTSDFFRDRSGCDILRRPVGFTTTANDDSSFFICSGSQQKGYTVDFFPMLSMTKISPCFSDILFPIEYYYDRAHWGGKYSYPNNIEWRQKDSRIYWRGTASGGMIYGSNYHNFTRFKLAKFAQEHSDVVDAAITTWTWQLCSSGCDEDTIRKEYNISGNGTPREDGYKYKYVLDVDGTTFSGRYLGLLRSGSLVFKATVFEEYFNDWIRPYEHYIPVLLDLSDLIEKVEWAKSHDAEARMIQERGRELAQRVMTDGQNDCYFLLVLLEWARLQDISRKAMEQKAMEQKS
ncbi:glycosyl transferase family 90-domain-containing protein [Mycena rebaudengoi]|nr:glycosyl transferase family 90-domain-containing protein [Mycena rebaudengoi]